MFTLEMYWAVSNYFFSVCMLITFPKKLKINLNSNLAIVYVCDMGLLHDLKFRVRLIF